MRTAGDTPSNQEVAIQFVAGLPPAYAMISTVLMSADRPMVIDEMLPKLLSVEQAAAAPPPSRGIEAALAAKPKQGFGKWRGNQKPRSSSEHNVRAQPRVLLLWQEGSHQERLLEAQAR